jgi:hypothetical protein
LRILIRADDYSPYSKIDTYTVHLYLRSVAERQQEFWRKGFKKGLQIAAQECQLCASFVGIIESIQGIS